MADPTPSRLRAIPAGATFGIHYLRTLDGTPYPLVHGGADEPPAPAPTPEPATPPAPEPEVKGPADQLDWQAAARKHEREKKDALAELDKLRSATATQAEKDLAAARQEAADAARTEMGPELTKLRMELAVLKSDDAKALKDPSDALAFIPADAITNDDGTVNDKALTKAIAALLESKPHLAAEPKGEPQFPDIGQGYRPPPAPEPGIGKDRILAAFSTPQK